MIEKIIIRRYWFPTLWLIMDLFTFLKITTDTSMHFKCLQMNISMSVAGLDEVSLDRTLPEKYRCQTAFYSKVSMWSPSKNLFQENPTLQETQYKKN